MIKNCLKCGLVFECENKKYDKKYCSRKCANSRNWDENHKKKLSHLMKISSVSKSKKDLTKWEFVKCQNCSIEFEVYKKKGSKYCSRKCSRKMAYKNCGGYRKNSGRSKHGHYKGIYCGSTYELAWVIYRLDHNLPVIRFEGSLVCKVSGRKYIPDFIDDNTIIEIKGYEKENSVEVKTKIAESYGYCVKVLRKDDLQVEFNWVTSKYNKLNFEALYDDYKPKFDYICTNCGKSFSRDRKSETKNDTAFCTRSCVGKYVSKNFKKVR